MTHWPRSQVKMWECFKGVGLRYIWTVRSKRPAFKIRSLQHLQLVTASMATSAAEDRCRRLDGKVAVVTASTAGFVSAAASHAVWCGSGCKAFSLPCHFRIDTVRYAECQWRMRRHGPVIAHCTDSEDFPGNSLPRANGPIRPWPIRFLALSLPS